MSDMMNPVIPRNVAVRPVNKGMIRNTPSNAVPLGGMLQAQNYRIEEYGPKRRGGYNNENHNSPPLDYNQFNERHEHSVYFYKKNDEAEQVLLTNRRCYDISVPNSSTPHRLRSEITGTTHSAASAGDTITIDMTLSVLADNTKLRTGDRVVLPDLSKDYGEIVNVGNLVGSVLTVDLELAVDVVQDELNIALEFDHLFFTEKRKNVSYAVLPYTEAGTAVDEKLFIADQSQRGIYTLSSGTGGDDLELLNIKNSTDTSITQNPFFVAADGITYYSDRAWAWGITDRDDYYSQRIRWSIAGNFEVWRDQDFVDLPYSSGEIINLVPMGPLLVAYFTDAVYIGRQTSIIGLPYKFEKLETGSVGLVNQKAVAPWVDGHFFVGEDNIYYLSGSGGLQEIGSTVLEDTLDECRRRELIHLIQLEHDPPTSTMVFYFPENSFPDASVDSTATLLWRWHYRTKAWAFDKVPYLDNGSPAFEYTALVSTRAYIAGNSWETFGLTGTDYPNQPNESPDWNQSPENDGTIWNRKDPDQDPLLPAFSDYNSWDALKNEKLLPKQLYISVRYRGKIVMLEETQELENDTIGELLDEYPIEAVLESPDFDLNTPDLTKVFNRLSIKTYRNLQDPQGILDINGDPLEFSLELSGDFGYSWKRPTQLRLRNNYNEGKSNFRVSGSALRFRLVNNQAIEPFKISEFVMRVSSKGLQIRS